MSKWKDIATISVPKADYATQAYNTERFDNIISKRFFYSETVDGRITGEASLQGLFNKASCVYNSDATSLGMPSYGAVFSLAFSNYNDAPNVAVGMNLLIDESGNLYFRRVANSSNGGNTPWKKVATV